jgi:hypothetical protein
MNTWQGSVLGLSVALAASPAIGQLHAGDLVLTIENQRVVVNGVDAVGGLVPNRVFADRFGKLGPSLPNRTPDPGYNAAGGEFIVGQTVGVIIDRAARIWTPGAAGSGEFCTIPDERIQIRKSGFTIETPATDPADLVGPSIELGFTDPIDGQFHEHGVYWLTEPFGPGVYLLEVRVWVGGPPGSGSTVLPSEPVWLVFSQERPQQEVDGAVAWLQTHVANVPGSGGALCPGPACECDWNDTGELTVQDVFDFLASYFTGAGDANGDGDTTVQDIFDFLACYFNGCP